MSTYQNQLNTNQLSNQFPTAVFGRNAKSGKHDDIVIDLGLACDVGRIMELPTMTDYRRPDLTLNQRASQREEVRKVSSARSCRICRLGQSIEQHRPQLSTGRRVGPCVLLRGSMTAVAANDHPLMPHQLWPGFGPPYTLGTHFPGRTKTTTRESGRFP